MGGGDAGAPGGEGPASQTQGRKGFRQGKTVTFAFRENEMGMESGGEVGEGQAWDAEAGSQVVCCCSGEKG